jgi:hypothetical protein
MMFTSQFGLANLRVFSATCLVALMATVFPSNADAASMVTGMTLSTPSSAVNPASYDVFLDVNDPLTIDVDVTVPFAPTKLDLFLLQDLSGSFSNDLPILRNLIPDLVSEISDIVADTNFGVGSFVDKPISPFGSESRGAYVYRTDLSLTNSETALQNTIDDLKIITIGDLPEAQLSALLQTAVRASGEIGFRDDAFRVVVLSTDDIFHEAGDFDSQPANNGDAILDGKPEGTGEDYPSKKQVRDSLLANRIIPIFAVTSNHLATYKSLVDDWGFGSAVQLSSDSSDLVEAIKIGLSEAFEDITLILEGDDFDYVQGISPDIFTDVPKGDTRTFNVTLLADGIADKNDTLDLIVPGYGKTIVDIDVDRDKSETVSVSEPSTAVGLALFAILGLTVTSKRNRQAA